MATEQKIGAVFVEVMAKGLASVQTSLTGLRSAMTKTAEGGKEADKAANAMAESAKRATEQYGKLASAVQKVGTFAQRAFLVGAGAIGAFIRTADPVGFERMQGTLGALSVQIGSIFIPLLDMVQKQLSGLLGWFRSLTDAQKSNILHWVEAAGAVLLVAVALPRLMFAFNAVGSVIMTVAQPALAAFGVELGVVSGGIIPLVGAIITAVAALAFLGAAFSSGGKEAGAFGAVFKPIKAVVDGLVDLFNRIGEAVKPALNTMGVALALFGRSVEKAFAAYAPAGKAFVDGVVSVIAKAAEAYRQFVAAIAPLATRLWEVISAVLSALAPIFAAFESAVFGAMGGAIDAFTSFIEGVTPIIDAVADVFGLLAKAIGVFASLVSPIVSAVGSVFGSVFTGVGKILQALWEVVSTVFGAIRDAFDEVTEAFGGDFGDLTGLVNAFASGFQGLAQIIAAACKQIAAAIHALKPVFDSVFSFMNRMLESVIRNFIYWAAVMKELQKGNLTGAGKEGDKAVKAYDERLKKLKEDRKKERSELLDKPKDEKENFTPMAAQKAELTGVAEAWKKAQTASQSPQDSADKERNKLLQETLKKHQEEIEIAKKIKEALDKKNGAFSL